jgi:drug/metabolite transporter (DMT)-like permease
VGWPAKINMTYPSSSTRLKADLTLLLVALIWGSSFVAQRVAAQSMSVYLFNGLRFLIGGLVLLPFLLRQKRPWFRLADFPGVALAGFFLFAGNTLQQYGLRTTSASNAGFITGLYVVLIPLILAVFLRQSPPHVVWLAALLAAVGLYLLSTSGSFILASGDAYELAGAVVWALHVLMISWLVKRVDIFPLAVIQYTVCGVLSLAAAKLVETPSSAGFTVIWWTVLYTSLFSIGLGYTLQAVGQKVAPPADAAIIMSSEAVFAALSGWLLLDEHLSGVQLLGCGLMLAGMILAQVFPLRATVPNIYHPGKDVA